MNFTSLKQKLSDQERTNLTYMWFQRDNLKYKDKGRKQRNEYELD